MNDTCLFLYVVEKKAFCVNKNDFPETISAFYDLFVRTIALQVKSVIKKKKKKSYIHESHALEGGRRRR